MHKQYGITVQEALSLNIVNRLRVVGGHQGLNRIIKLVNVIEVPDIMEWAQKGEFFLTTGYSFREYPELMEQLIPKMAEVESAALAIKPKRFLKEIPCQLIASADKYNIPLLEVPYDLSFSEITAPILEVIFNKQNIILQRLDQGHKILMDLVLSGSNLIDLCRETSRLINNPVAIVDQEGVIYLSADDPNLPRFEAFFSEESTEVKNEKLRFGNISEVRYSLESASGQGKTITIQVIRIPITTAQTKYGNICAIADNPIIETDILLLERAATIAALEFTKRKAIFEIEKNYYNEFLEILLSCEFNSEDEIIKRGQVFNIDLRQPTAVILINDNTNTLEKVSLPAFTIGKQSVKEELLKAIHGHRTGKEDGRFIAGIKGSNIVAIVELPPGEPKSSLKKAVEGLYGHLKNTCRFRDNLSIKIGVGRPYQEVWKISQSFWEAREALRICLLSHSFQVTYFDDLGFLRILSEKNRADLEKYVFEFLYPVFEYDREKNGELIKTLETYFESNRNLKLTAQMSFIHYNTVLYRIRKIEDILGISLSNPEHLLNLEIAINIVKFFRSEANGKNNVNFKFETYYHI